METQHESDSPVLEGTPSSQRRHKRRSKKPKTQKAINSAINSAIEARRARTDERDASSDSLNFVHNTNSPTGVNQINVERNCINSIKQTML